MDQVGELQRLKARLMLRRAEMDIEIDQVEALIASAPERPAGTECAHQNLRRVTNMGADHDTFVCRDCGVVFERPFPEAP